MADNVTTLVPRDHWTFDIYELKEGYMAEGLRNGQLLWEFQSDSLLKIVTVISRTVGGLDDSSITIPSE